MPERDTTGSTTGEPVAVKCPNCNGNGRRRDRSKCPRCGGSAWILDRTRGVEEEADDVETGSTTRGTT